MFRSKNSSKIKKQYAIQKLEHYFHKFVSFFFKLSLIQYLIE